jgi:integrase
VFPPARPGAPCKRVYVFRFRSKNGRKQRLVTLGQHGPLTVHKAREMAADLYEAVRKGRDPVADEERAKGDAKEAAAEAAYTFDRMVDEWTAERLAKRRSRYAAEAVRAIRRGLADLLGRPATQITRDDAAHALRKIVRAGHPVTAGRTMAYARACFSWAAALGKVLGNPFAGLPIDAGTTERERVLTDDEIAEVWAAAGILPYPFGPFYRLSMLTLQRRGEVAGMRWSEITPDMSKWTIPGSRMKNGRAHDVHLSEAARAVVRTIPRVEGCNLVFSTTAQRVAPDRGAVPKGGRRAEPTPISGFSQGRRYLDAAIAEAREAAAAEGRKPEPMVPWRLHDLRRTGVTKLAALGFDSIVADKLLAHQPAKLRGVAGVYQRHEFAEERARALDAWAAHVTGEQTDNFLPFRTRQIATH